MNGLKEFNSVMKETPEIALATSVGDKPNVRIINYVTLDDTQNCLYFATFPTSPKTQEFEENSGVAFTTLPYGDKPYVRVHEGQVRKSSKGIFDLAEDLIAKVPAYKEIIDMVGDTLAIYEISFTKASITLDFQTNYQLDFNE